jgi:hypothetical protein
MARAAWSGLVSVRAKSLQKEHYNVFKTESHLDIYPFRLVLFIFWSTSFRFMLSLVLWGVGRNFITGTISTAIGQLALLLELSIGE